MMNKPAEWENTKAVMGGYNRLPAGGYKCRIVGVQLTQSRKGDEMLNVYFDIDSGEYEGYFARQYVNMKNNANGGEVKWPNDGTIHQVTGGKMMGRFKGLILAIEECNPGWNWNWDEQELKDKKIGIVLREEEYIGSRDGAVHTSLNAYSYHPLDEVEDVEVPPVKKVANEGSNYSYQSGGSSNGFMGDDDIPF